MTTDIRTRTEPTDRGNYEVVTEAAALPAMLQRISWGAVLAGVVVALVTHLTLSMLGVSFGASAIDPLKEVDPLDPQLGTGVVIWMVASTLISLFAGGWVAGRLAGIPDGTDGVLHGLLTWAVVSLLTVFLLTTGIGNLLSGATRILGQGLTLAGEGVAALAPEAAEAVEEQSIALQSVLDEARTLLIAPSTATSATTPQTGAQTPGKTPQGDTVPPTGASQATTPAETDESSPTVPERRANLVIGRLLRLGVNATDEDRTAVVNLLA